jgi:hypothetical protein
LQFKVSKAVKYSIPDKLVMPELDTSMLVVILDNETVLIFFHQYQCKAISLSSNLLLIKIYGAGNYQSKLQSLVL